MTSCGRARAAILAVVRGQAGEAERLLLEEHLERCEACAAERAQWLLMERLGSAPHPTLSTTGRARVLRRLTALSSATEPARPRRSSAPRWLGASFAVAAAALALVLARPWRARPSAEPARIVRSTSDGEAELAGARLAWRAGTALRIDGGHRRIDLEGGEIDVEVTPGGPGRFRVYAPRFIVEVLGTRFVVRTDGVRTLHGRVRVLDRAERELAVVTAGQSWSASVLAAPAPASVAGPALALAPPAPAKAELPKRATVASEPRPVRRASHREVEPPSTTSAAADAVVAEAERALARGDVASARARLDDARAAAPARATRAAIDLLAADALLVERRRADAVAAYRRAAASWGDLAAGEQAAFALAEILCEDAAANPAAVADARAALQQYLARYPQGRFAREATERLQSLAQ